MISSTEQKIETDGRKRKNLLGNYLIAIYFFVDLFFYLVSLSNPLGTPPIFIVAAAISLSCFLLLRKGFVELALFAFLVRANVLVYLFSAKDSLETGNYFYFTSCVLAPLALYGYKERWKGALYSVLSFGLFLFTEFKYDQFAPNKAHFYFIVNFTIVLFTMGFMLMFFDWINEKAEKTIIEKNEELEKAYQELDRFVYHASHDLRAPLSSILGLTHVYSLDTKPEEGKKIVDMISDRAVKLDTFIKEILAYSQNSRMEPRREKVFINALLRDCIDSLQYVPNFESVKLNIMVAADDYIVSDQNRLKIILLNLLSNSIKYADLGKNGPFVNIKTESDPRFVKIAIEDNGIGIEKEYQEKVFEMFFRAHTQSEGSGLGLYLVSECMKKISGQIQLVSKVGEGTKMTLILPKKSFQEGSVRII